MLDGLTVTRDAFPRTVRLVSTARLRPSVLLDLVDEDDLGDLFEIEGATSHRRILEARGSSAVMAEELVHGVPYSRFINASFTYPNPRSIMRFNGTERGAWYAALETATCIEEVKFHHTQFLAEAGEFNAVIEYAEMFASFAGEFLDLRPHPDLECLSPDKSVGYPAGNRVAESARAQGLNGIIYPSVRHEGGTCFAALFPHAVQSVAQGDVYRLTWSGTPNPRIEKAA